MWKKWCALRFWPKPYCGVWGAYIKDVVFSEERNPERSDPSLNWDRWRGGSGQGCVVPRPKKAEVVEGSPLQRHQGHRWITFPPGGDQERNPSGLHFGTLSVAATCLPGGDASGRNSGLQVSRVVSSSFLPFSWKAKENLELLLGLLSIFRFSVNVNLGLKRSSFNTTNHGPKWNWRLSWTAWPYICCQGVI